MDIKSKKKKPIPILVIFLFIFLFLFLVQGYLMNDYISERDLNCYISHVQECLYCHSENLTYALCSGFCFEPREMDLDNSSLSRVCIIHPIENCWNLPRECNL